MKSFIIKSYKILPFVFILFVFLSYYYFSNLKAHNFHLDEYLFIRKSYYFDLYFFERDFQDSRWYEIDAPDQPKVGPYLYGLTLHLSGIKNIERHFQKIGFSVYRIKGQEWWRALWWHKLVNLTPDTVKVLNPIWIGRKTAVIFTLAALLTLFTITYKIKGLIFGLISTLLLGTNSLMYWFGRLAMTDSMQLFFFFANLMLTLVYLKTLKTKNRSNIALVSLALGVNCALGVGVKVSGMLIYLFLIVFFLTLLVVHRASKSMVALLLLNFTIVTISFLALFVLLHPYTHRDTFPQLISIFTKRYSYAHEARLAQPGRAVYGRLDATKFILKRVFSPENRFADHILLSYPLDIFLFLVGFVIMMTRAFKKLLSNKITGEFVLLMWTVIVIGSLALYLRNDWPRYYLPTVAAITIMQAYAITTILQKIVSGKKLDILS